MKPVLLRDTPAYQFGVRPAVIPRSMTHVKVAEVINSMNVLFDSQNLFTFHLSKDEQKAMKTQAESASGDPERDAVVFYMMNHAASVIRSKYHPYESMAKDLPLVEEYHRQLAFRATRMFFYLLLICTRESRHDKASHDGSAWGKHVENYGKEVLTFHKSIKGKGSETAAEILRQSPPDIDLGRYTAFLSDCFYKGNYSSGFGGKAWGAVADVLRDYVHGKLSAEMMLDTSFTLCHNNGPIFNKGMLYGYYSDHIYMLLDVQRSGQIPLMVANKETKWANDSTIKALYELCLSHLPEEFSGYVDWFAVEKLGSLKKYPEQKKNQVLKYGHPDGSEVSEEKIAKPVTQKTKSQPVNVTELEVYPGQIVKKLKVRPS